jgi:hypothetical protein
MSPESRRKLSDDKLGNKNPAKRPEVREKLRKPKSDDHKKKLSIVSRLRTGSKNPAFNKKWIHNKLSDETLFINKNDLENYLNNGWILGVSNKTKNNMKNKKIRR